MILSLKGLGITRGDQIALVANAGFYESTAVYTVGATPVYIDVNPMTHCMCPDQLLRCLAQNPVKAVIVTHLYGQLADIKTIAEHCRNHGVALIEDCAQACGAIDTSGQEAGSFGDISCFSFYPTKNLGAYGDGGAICCRDTALNTRIRAVKQYGWRNKYVVDVPNGMNSRLDPVQAAVLVRKLPFLNEWNERRREIASMYTADLKDLLQCPNVVSAGKSYVAHLYVVMTEQRDPLRSYLTSCGIMSDVHYPISDYRQPAY